MQSLCCAPLQVPGITAIVLKHAGYDYDGKELAQRLAVLPDLTEVNCQFWQHMQDWHLRSLKGVRSLKALLLTRCMRLSSAAVMEVICSASSQGQGQALRELHCEVLDDQALLLLADWCHGLETLNLNLKRVLSLSSVEVLCNNNALALSSLELRAQGHDDSTYTLTESMLTNVISSCSLLRDVSLTNVLRRCHGRLVTHTATSCPQITSVELNKVHFAFNRHHGRQSCDVSFGDRVVEDDYEGFAVPVRAFDGSLLRQSLFAVWVDRFGVDLVTIVNLISNITDEMLLAMAVRCPNITKLCLAAANITDESLASFAQYCPLISYLQLRDGRLITDDGIVKVLEACKLDTISLYQFPLLTGVTLFKIADRFPAATTKVSLISAHTSKDAMLQLLLQRKLRSAYIGCNDSTWIKQKLEVMQFSPMPEFVGEQVGHKVDFGSDAVRDAAAKQAAALPSYAQYLQGWMAQS